MEYWQRSKYVARIVSGQTRLKIKNEIFYVKTPQRLQKCLAEEIFHEKLWEAEQLGAYSQEELGQFLSDKGIWTEDNEAILKTANDNLDKLKAGLYTDQLKEKVVRSLRLYIQTTKNEILRLEILKHSHDYVSSLGIAHAAKQRYLLGCSIYYSNGNAYWENEDGWDKPDFLLDSVAIKLREEELNEAEFRELARSDPWRNTWNLHKYCGQGILDIAAVDMSDEQKMLVTWSGVYDNIMEHPDNLSSGVIEDDDMLDGWMIIKRREREKNQVQSAVDKLTGNEKIKNAAEQFIPAENMGNPNKVMELNDAYASNIFKQRMNVVKKSGEAGVAEQHLPDVRMRIQQEAVQKFAQQVKGNK